MCFDILTYTLGCSCRIFEGDKVVAICTRGCPYAAPDSANPSQICDPVLNGRPRLVVPSVSVGVSCTVHDMLVKRGDDPTALAPYVHQDLAGFIGAKAFVKNDAFRDFRRTTERELNTKVLLGRYLHACRAVNPRRALSLLEEDLDYEVNAIEEPRAMIKAAVPEYLEEVGK